MASSSSSPRTWRYRVFTSFHGPDVRNTCLSHLRKQFNGNGITMFDDNGIERSHIIASALTQAIRESRISIVLLSKNYASSSWCLDELLEILKCKEDLGQIVTTIFYGVDPSDVRKQTGESGNVFEETCARKTEEEKRKWSQALTYVGNIAGEHFQNCSFEKMESLLDLDYDGVKIVGISGSPGIGKSTISRALQNMLSNRFQLTCFVDNLMENYKIGLGEYGLKLCLQEKLLSKILNQDGMRIRHLGVIQERLYDQKVLIILDDVESLDQLEALANIMWFGPGSRVIVNTENIEILQQHGINDIYHVGFPSKSEALMIFCQSAFRQTSPPDGFMNLANEVATICGNLPLSMDVLGSLLRGKSRADWIDALPRLKNCLDGRIERVLKVGYESLHEKDQALFLHIAVFFNYEHVDHVTSMLAKNNLDVRFGLKVLANKHLIHIDHGNESRVVMHRLLQVMARQVISRQEPWKRQILVDAQEICYVLEKAEGNGSIVGVSFDVAEINELMINTRAFERMCNLAFLKVYDGRHTRKRKLLILEEIGFPRHLRLLHWDAYPGKSLPLRFCIENLVELNMAYSELEKLWDGIQPLANLKEMNFIWSSRLKELPDLSNATNLESLDISGCVSLVELTSSIANLQKLDDLVMNSCESLEVIPSFINLVSLECIDMIGCSRLRSFPEFPNNIMSLAVTETTIEEVPASIRHCSGLKYINLSGRSNLKTLTHLPMNVRRLNLSNSGIERIIDCIKGLHDLQYFNLSSCKKLTSLPELPCSLKFLKADDCESLERVSGPLNTPHAQLNFINCFKLDRQARQAITQHQQSFACGWAVLPGREVPVEFDHRAKGNSLDIPHSAFNRVKICIVISPNHEAGEFMVSEQLHHCKVHSLVSSSDLDFDLSKVSKFRMEHLFIFNYGHTEVSKKIVVKFSSSFQAFDVIECGMQILMDKTDRSNNGESGDEEDDDKEDDESREVSKDKDEGILSNKRPRKMTMTSAATNLKWGIQRQRF